MKFRGVAYLRVFFYADGTKVSGHYREGGCSSGVAIKRGSTVFLNLTISIHLHVHVCTFLNMCMCSTLTRIDEPYPMLVLCGPPGSGKGYFCKLLVEEFPNFFGLG